MSVKLLGFSFKQGLYCQHGELEKLGRTAEREIQRISQAMAQGKNAERYVSEYASVNLPSDEAMRNNIKQMVAQKQELQPTVLVVIGIGGSNLGAMAVHEALFGRFYNEYMPNIKLYFVDTIDSDGLNDILLLIEQEFEVGSSVIVNVVSKSGNTTEVTANFEIFYEIMQDVYGATFSDYMVITTDYGSPLWHFAQQHHISCLEIPKNVGGRYSVFSAAALFPLALIGVNIDDLCRGAQDMLNVCTSLALEDNPAVLSAAALAHYYGQGYAIHDTFLFSVDLHKLGLWYRQLMAESIGKEYSQSGKQVFAGMTPTVSIGSTDLHSVAQLYLAGPYDKITTFVTVEKNKSDIVVPPRREFESLMPFIQDKSLNSIMDAIVRGTQAAYTKSNRPFMSIILPEKTEYFIGQYLQVMMLQTIYLGFLLEVNPFDQPNVQLYKDETRKLLQ